MYEYLLYVDHMCLRESYSPEKMQKASAPDDVDSVQHDDIAKIIEECLRLSHVMHM